MGKIQPTAPLINKIDGKANPFDNSGKPLYQVLEPTQVKKQFFCLFINSFFFFRKGEFRSREYFRIITWVCNSWSW